METAHSQTAALNRVQVVTVGAFGKAFARCLSDVCANIEELNGVGIERLDPNAWPPADICIVAAGRPVPAFCKALDEFSFHHARPFVPVIVDSSALCVGPIIVPGRSGCWQCWQLRSLQHATLRQERSAMLQFYEAHAHAGPAGYLEPFAMVGAAKVASTLQSPTHLQESAGHIWQIDLFTREVSVGYLIGVDGCPRCGLGRPLEDRTYADVREKLAFLRKDATKKGDPANRNASPWTK